MSEGIKKSWGGKRDNQTGRAVNVPTGDGTKHTYNVRAGSDLMDGLRKRWPHLADPDLIRAAMWEAVGVPIEDGEGKS